MEIIKNFVEEYHNVISAPELYPGLISSYSFHQRSLDPVARHFRWIQKHCAEPIYFPKSIFCLFFKISRSEIEGVRNFYKEIKGRKLTPDEEFYFSCALEQNANPENPVCPYYFLRGVKIDLISRTRDSRKKQEVREFFKVLESPMKPFVHNLQELGGFVKLSKTVSETKTQLLNLNFDMMDEWSDALFHRRSLNTQGWYCVPTYKGIKSRLDFCFEEEEDSL